jgi:hypothetical protein
VLFRSLPRITLKSKDDIWLPIPEEERQKSWYLETERILKAHTQLLDRSDLRLSDDLPLLRTHYAYFRRFKGSLEVTGRLYSTFINYPKRDRLGVTFAGEQAMSIDLVALHPTLLLRVFYLLENEPAGLFSGGKEVYSMPWFKHLPREVHKRAINALINASSPKSAEQCLNVMYYWYDAEKDEIKVEVYDKKKKRYGLKAFPGNSKEIRQYIEEFKIHHPLFEKFIFRSAGNWLQKLDSNVLLELIDRCNQAEIPILPVHDEVVFPLLRRTEVERNLAYAFRHVLKDYGAFGQLPIKSSYILSGETQSERQFLALDQMLETIEGIQFQRADRDGHLASGFVSV